MFGGSYGVLKDAKVIDGTGNSKLALEICKKLAIPLVKTNITTFRDGEICVEILENMRGQEVFIIQSLSYPVNDNLMKLMLIIDALKRASASQINIVCPYLCYSRQDRKAGPRTPISAKIIANMLSIDADRIITVDLHAQQIQGFYDIPLDNLYGSIVFQKYIKDNINISNSVIVSPDVGGVRRARSYGEYLNLPIVIVEKRRQRAGECEALNVIGDIKDKDCIIVDDMIDSGGTICKSAKILKDMGAQSLKVVVTHGVLSPGSIEKLDNSVFDKIYISDTIDNSTKINNSNKFVVVSFVELLAETIRRINHEESVSSLFN